MYLQHLQAMQQVHARRLVRFIKYRQDNDILIGKENITIIIILC